MARMHNPPHPGEVLKDGVLEGGLSIAALSDRLKVSRVHLSRIVNGHASVTADMALRLAAALGGSPESWLQMQQAYDLWQAEKKRRPKIVPLDVDSLNLSTGAVVGEAGAAARRNGTRTAAHEAERLVSRRKKQPVKVAPRRQQAAKRAA